MGLELAELRCCTQKERTRWPTGHSWTRGVGSFDAQGTWGCWRGQGDAVEPKKKMMEEERVLWGVSMGLDPTQTAVH